MPKAFAAAGRSFRPALPDADRSRLEAILNQSSIDLRDRSSAWQKSGWTGYDPASQPYTADQVQKERQTYGGGLR